MVLRKFLPIILLLLGISFVSCSDDKDEPDNNTSASEDYKEYYVKYEISGYSIQPRYNSISATITTEKGIVTMTIPTEWEGTFGPFSKLEKLQCSMSYPSHNSATHFHGRISICRGNQPFILKADKSISGEPLNMSYTVTHEDLK